MAEEISEEKGALEVSEESPPIEGGGKDEEFLQARDLTLFFHQGDQGLPILSV